MCAQEGRLKKEASRGRTAWGLGTEVRREAPEPVGTGEVVDLDWDFGAAANCEFEAQCSR